MSNNSNNKHNSKRNNKRNSNNKVIYSQPMVVDGMTYIPTSGDVKWCCETEKKVDETRDSDPNYLQNLANSRIASIMARQAGTK